MKKLIIAMAISCTCFSGCKDTSKNKQDSDANAEVTQKTISTDAAGDQYHSEGLTRYENNSSEAPAEEAPQIPENAPIRIELKLNSAYAELGLGKIEVQATTDQVTIDKVIINRGQCSAIDNSIPMPVTLSFGRTYTGYINNCALDKVIEVQINTNLGNWTFDTK